jgi:hypothetical protein
MTTGLQRSRVLRHHRLRTAAPPGRLSAILRSVAVRFRTVPTPTRQAGLAMSAPRAAHNIRRGVHAAGATSARDLHDTAVLGGVFPPRM